MKFWKEDVNQGNKGGMGQLGPGGKAERSEAAEKLAGARAAGSPRKQGTWLKDFKQKSSYNPEETLKSASSFSGCLRE